MLSPMRTLMFLAFAIQALLGPAHLTVEVCHGRVQLPANDGSSCCGPSHGHDEGDEASEEALDDECSACFDIELSASDESIATPDVLEFQAPSVALTTSNRVASVWPVTEGHSFQVTRAPPPGVTPTGLLPGAFPLRI